MILSRKHEYSVGNMRCAFAITTRPTRGASHFSTIFFMRDGEEWGQ